MPNGSKTSSWQDYQSKLKATPGQDRNAGIKAAETIFGGPIGWYEALSGKSVLGNSDPFDRTTLDDSMTEDVYNSMSAQEWQDFAHMSEQEKKDWIAGRTKELGPAAEAAAKQKAQEAQLQTEANNRKAEQQKTIDAVSKFADEMNMPIDQLMQKDEFAQALNKQTYQNSMGQSMNTGALGGGLSQANADQATKNALLGYQMQRQQIGQQAYNSAFNMVNQQGMQAEDIRRYNQGLDLTMQGLRGQAQYQSYQQGLAKQQGMYGMIGGLIGMTGGPSGAAAGQQIGSAVGGASYGSYTPYKYSYPSAAGGAGGGGLGSYNGGMF